MLSNPKWILFYFLFFGSAIVIGYMLNGVWTPGHMTDFDGLESVKTAVSYDYAWMGGAWQPIRWALLVVQGVGGALIIYELVSGFIGRR